MQTSQRDATLGAVDTTALQLNALDDDVLKEARRTLRNTGRYIRWSFWIVCTMYIVLFAVGITSAAISIGKAIVARSATDAVATSVTAGLSASSFFGLFLARPLESLERNAIYATWLSSVTSTFWTRVMYQHDVNTVDKDLVEMTDNLSSSLLALAEQHAKAIGKLKQPKQVAAHSKQQE